MRDADEMSQLRNSLHGSSRGTPTGTGTPTRSSGLSREPFVASRQSDMSFANTDLSSLEGMPEHIQPVHCQSRGDGRDWPLP